MAFRVLITGSRSWYCERFADRIIASLVKKHGRENLLVVHGACPTGIDVTFALAATEQGVRVEAHPADWDRYGKGAGPRRNQEMVDAGANFCLAFSPNLAESRGTADCVRRALLASIPTWLINHEDGKPIRQRLPETDDEVAAPAAET